MNKYIWIPATVLLALYGATGTYTALRFDVSVLPYSTLDSSKASETRFLVTNQGPFAIENVYYVCKFVPKQNGPGPMLAFGTAVPFPVAKLHSHGVFSIHCSAPAAFPDPMPEQTMLDIEIMYSSMLLPWQHPRGGELFLLKQDVEHHAVWIPVGDMTPGADDLRSLQCPNCAK